MMMMMMMIKKAVYFRIGGGDSLGLLRGFEGIEHNVELLRIEQ
jgi:hypothetical protein